MARADPNLVVEGKPAYSNASIEWITPDPGQQFRVEPSASLFLYAELNMKSEALKAAPTVARMFAMNVFEVQVATAQKASLADAAVQIADSKYASDYKLTADAVAEGSRDLADFLAMYGLKAVKPKLEISQAIATSPGGSAKSDVDAFKAGDTVRFTVSMDAASVRYAAIGYNVAEVRIYRKATPEPVKVASFTASPDQTTFVLDWQADVAGTVDGSFYAFVVTSLLGFAPLEIAPVTPGSDPTESATSTATPVPVARPCPVVERSLPTGRTWLSYASGTGIRATLEITTYGPDGTVAVTQKHTVDAVYVWSDQGDLWHYNKRYTETRYRAGSEPDSFTTESSGEARDPFYFQEVRAYGPHTEADGSEWFPDGSAHEHKGMRPDNTLAWTSITRWSGCLIWKRYLVPRSRRRGGAVIVEGRSRTADRLSSITA